MLYVVSFSSYVSRGEVGVAHVMNSFRVLPSCNLHGAFYSVYFILNEQAQPEVAHVLRTYYLGFEERDVVSGVIPANHS